MTETLTHSRRACFLDCPRKHLLSYVYRLRPQAEGRALSLGRAWALLRDPKTRSSVESSLDPYDWALLRELDARYTPTHEPLDYEVPFLFSRATHDEAGVMDGIVRREGRLAVLERKTTSAFGPSYWDRLEFDAQTATYFDAAREMGLPVETVLYEVQEIPSIRPLKATPLDKRKLKKDGTLYANQREVDETPSEFGARVAEWADAEPRLHVREVSMTTQRLEEAEADRTHVTQLILAGYHHRNSAACSRFSSCDYLPICHRTDLDTEVPDGFKRLDTTNPEIPAHV